MTPSKRENLDDDASFQVFSFYNILSDHDELSRPFFSSSSFQPRFPLKRDASWIAVKKRLALACPPYCASCVHLEKGNEDDFR